MMYGYYGSDYMFGHILSTVIWIVVIFCIFGFFRSHRGWRRGMWDHHNRGMEVLKERYAKGEITKEEFESKKKDLMSY